MQKLNQMGYNTCNTVVNSGLSGHALKKAVDNKIRDNLQLWDTRMHISNPYLCFNQLYHPELS